MTQVHKTDAAHTNAKTKSANGSGAKSVDAANGSGAKSVDAANGSGAKSVDAANALDGVRKAAQSLHRDLSDATKKRGDAMKADLQSIPAKAKAVAASLKESLGAQSEAIKKHLTDAKASLEATEKHVTACLKTTGHEAQASARRAISDSHAAVNLISEAVAAKRTSDSTHAHP